MARNSAKLFPFEGQLMTSAEVAAVYTTCGKDSVRRMLNDGLDSIAAFNLHLSKAEFARRNKCKPPGSAFGHLNPTPNKEPA